MSSSLGPVLCVPWRRPRQECGLRARVWLAGTVLAALGSAGCDSASTSADSLPVMLKSDAVGPSTSDEQAVSDGHTAGDEHDPHDCRSAHPEGPVAAATATALSLDARRRLTTLRISAHEGGVILRKKAASWVALGPRGCTVPPDRMERVLDNLESLKAVPASARPADGDSFELQIVALNGEERALHFDVADRNDQGDLIQLNDYSTFRVRGLDRRLLSPRPQDWCVDHRSADVRM